MRPELQDLRIWATVGLLIMIVAQVFFVANFIYTMMRGPKAPANPYDSNTLEWAAAPSPPPHGNFNPMPRVYRAP